MFKNRKGACDPVGILILIACILATAILVIAIPMKIQELRNKDKVVETEKTDAEVFKEKYEILNGKLNSYNKEHRELNIPENNPMVLITPEVLKQKLENNESFYLYLGSPICPDCRKVIETAMNSAINNHVKKIYYLDVWDENGKEIFRNKYELVDGKPVETIKGHDVYYELLEKFKDSEIIFDYKLTDKDSGEEYDLKQKRIWLPSFFLVKDGELIYSTTGESDSMTNPFEELKDEYIKEELEKFDKLFTYNDCHKAC